MIIHINVDTDGRLERYADAPYHLGDDEIEVDKPTELTPENMRDWVLVDGVLVPSPLEAVEAEPEPDTVAALQALLAQTNNDLMAFYDYFFTMFPEES